jgi:hypothetical protein
MAKQGTYGYPGGLVGTDTFTGLVGGASADIPVSAVVTLVYALTAVSFATLASPAFTGTPTAPTATTGDNSTKLATTAFVQAAVALAGGSYAPLASPAFTGTPTAPTATAGASSAQLANTQFVSGAIATETARAEAAEAALAVLVYNALLSTVTAYQVAPSDATGAGVIRSTSASPVVVTVPKSTTQALALRTPIFLNQYGAGQLSVAGATGVTINSPSTLLLKAQYAWAFIIQDSTDVWSLEGDIQ